MKIITMNQLEIGDVIAPLEKPDEFPNWKEEKVKDITKSNDMYFIDVDYATIPFHETDKVILIRKEI